MKFKFDISWFGMGGIGKFSEEISKRIGQYYTTEFFKVKGSPASPLSTIILTLKITFDRHSFYFLPGYIPPLGNKDRFVFTIHDLNHLDIPDNSGFFKRAFYNIVIKRGCHNSFKILTVSEFSKSKIIEWSGVDESKVIVTGNGVSDVFKPVSNSNNAKRYYLSVSNRKSHKNEKRIIQAFSSAKISNEIQLVMTGNPTTELADLIEHLGIKDKVFFTGYVEENELVTLYNNADVLLFPSQYEGFGIPVLEAMACGTPVITSNTTSLPEVAGEAAILVDPTSVDEIKAAIEILDSNSNLKNQMIEKGIIQSKKFSWEKIVEIIRKEISDKINS